jgi:hypothetical protein
MQLEWDKTYVVCKIYRVLKFSTNRKNVDRDDMLHCMDATCGTVWL